MAGLHPANAGESLPHICTKKSAREILARSFFAFSVPRARDVVWACPIRRSSRLAFRRLAPSHEPVSASVRREIHRRSASSHRALLAPGGPHPHLTDDSKAPAGAETIRQHRASQTRANLKNNAQHSPQLG